MLKLEHVTKKFYENTINEKAVLDDFSLEVYKNDFVTIVGTNGAGKSTLFNIIRGKELVNEGRLILDHEVITYQKEYKRAKKIRTVFQDPMLGTAGSMTVLENLVLATRQPNTSMFHKLNKKDRSFFYDVLKQQGLGLETKLDCKVSTLSGGQRQALTLLMETIVPPALLLLDEHTAALDPIAKKKILDITKETVESKQITCIMITHNLNDALTYGNRLLVMQDGKILHDFNKEEKEQLSVDELFAMYNQA